MITRPEEEIALKQSPLVDASLTKSQQYSRSLSHISESSADGVVLTAGESLEVMPLASGVSINDIEMEMPRKTPERPGSAATEMPPWGLGVIEEKITVYDVTDQHPIREQQNRSVFICSTPKTEEDIIPQMYTDPHQECSTPLDSEDVKYIAQRVVVEEDMLGEGADCPGDAIVDSGLEDALGSVASSLDDYRGQFPELQILEQELKMLQVTLKVRITCEKDILKTYLPCAYYVIILKLCMYVYIYNRVESLITPVIRNYFTFQLG